MIKWLNKYFKKERKKERKEGRTEGRREGGKSGLNELSKNVYMKPWQNEIKEIG